MSEFIELNENEVHEIDAGGVVSCVAGTMAGGLIGAIVSLPYAAYKGSLSSVGHAAIAGASAGAYVGAGCPLP